MRSTLFSLISGLHAAVDLPEPVFEFGSRRVVGQEGLPPLASVLAPKTCWGVDMLPGWGVDAIADLHDLPYADDSIGTAILLDTMEHVRRPYDAMANLARCLKPDGLLVMTSVFHFPIHEWPDDYWRFTASGFEALVEAFPRAWSSQVGPRKMPHTVVALAGGAELSEDTWQRAVSSATEWTRTGATSWKERAVSLLPAQLMTFGYEKWAAKR
ncbi:MAG: Methyltransferase type 11 [Frankiales bacterium]|nr:Methyltransferase type 11 [Frankiales bacterium]